MSETDLNEIEAQLRVARPQFDDDADQFESELLLRRARRQVAARDVMGFAFANMLRTILMVFAGFYQQVQQKPKTTLSSKTRSDT